MDLDMTKPRNRILVAQAIKKRWGISDEVRESIIKSTVEAMESAAAEGNARDVAGCARVLVAAEAQNQADDHLADRNDRLDSGKPTDSIAVVRAP